MCIYNIFTHSFTKSLWGTYAIVGIERDVTYLGDREVSNIYLSIPPWSMEMEMKQELKTYATNKTTIDRTFSQIEMANYAFHL